MHPTTQRRERRRKAQRRIERSPVFARAALAGIGRLLVQNYQRTSVGAEGTAKVGAPLDSGSVGARSKRRGLPVEAVRTPICSADCRYLAWPLLHAVDRKPKETGIEGAARTAEGERPLEHRDYLVFDAPANREGSGHLRDGDIVCSRSARLNDLVDPVELADRS